MDDGARAGAQAPGAAAGPVIVELEHITKRFPGVMANRDISLAIRAGEVHALLGENGAGKSTLIAILAGMLQPDEGRILVRGEPVTFASPRSALELGIGTVFQHLTLVPTLSVLENLMLGGVWFRRQDVAGTRARLAELAGLLGVRVDADALVGRLSLGEQQQVEIIKALWRGEKLLVLDEPTSMLTPQGVRDLGTMIRRLRDSGVAVVFITHKLGEATEIGERISVLKQGARVGEITPEELSTLSAAEATARIVELMFAGRPAEAEAPGAPSRRGTAVTGAPPALELEAVSLAGAEDEVRLSDVSFTVDAGEIFGIAGVDGNGQKQLAEAIAGQRHLAAGDIRLAGRSIKDRTIGQRQALGLRYVTDDRLGEGTVATFPLSLNLLLKRIGQPPFWRHGLVRSEAIEENARALVAAFDVRTPSVRTPIAKLSGGNIQKALMARELTQDPKVVIYNKPTYGLDLANMEAMRTRIRAQSARGVTAVVISNELDELLELCDRIAVMLGGRIQGIVENNGNAEARVGELMIGGRAA